MYYPVAFEKEITSTPRSVQLQKKEYVLWKSKKTISVLPNRCPHRGAKLSDGRVVQSKIECPYHGWQFDKSGVCAKIPQLNPKQKIPKACNLDPISLDIKDGIIWLSENKDPFDYNSMIYYNNPDYFVSDYYLKAPYSYYLQIENLLDPAHLHFVHDGFQGNRNKASEIFISNFRENDLEIYGYFEHANNDTPDIAIKFLKPSIVEVSIYDKKNKTLLRKNIIYTSPIDDKSCNVLFRDVAMKKTLIPETNGFLSFHGNLLINKPFIENNYQLVNQKIIKSIMEQDLNILIGQQQNYPEYQNFVDSRYIMPAQSDRMINAFRNWIRKNETMKI